MIVTKYNIEQIHNNWSVISKFIDKSIADGQCEDFESLDIKEYLYNEQMFCYAVIDKDKIVGVVIIALHIYPKQTIAFITCYGGKSITNKDYLNKLINEFKKLGITKIQGNVRESVARLTNRLGFINKQILVEYKL